MINSVRETSCPHLMRRMLRSREWVNEWAVMTWLHLSVPVWNLPFWVKFMELSQHCTKKLSHTGAFPRITVRDRIQVTFLLVWDWPLLFSNSLASHQAPSGGSQLTSGAMGGHIAIAPQNNIQAAARHSRLFKLWSQPVCLNAVPASFRFLACSWSSVIYSGT